MKKIMLVFTMITMLITAKVVAALVPGEEIRDYVIQKYPGASHLEIFSSGNGISKASFVYNGLHVAILFDINNHPVAIEKELAKTSIPVSISEKISNDATIEHCYEIHLSSGAKFYHVDVKENSKVIRKIFDENGHEAN